MNKGVNGGKIYAKREKNFAPPPRASRGGGANLNRKFKTFDFLDTLKDLHTYTIYIPNTIQGLLYLSIKQNKQKKSKLMFLILFTLIVLDLKL